MFKSQSSSLHSTLCSALHPVTKRRGNNLQPPGCTVHAENIGRIFRTPLYRCHPQVQHVTKRITEWSKSATYNHRLPRLLLLRY
jgi:hypothetical protein